MGGGQGGDVGDVEQPIAFREILPEERVELGGGEDLLKRGRQDQPLDEERRRDERGAGERLIEHAHAGLPEPVGQHLRDARLRGRSAKAAIRVLIEILAPGHDPVDQSGLEQGTEGGQSGLVLGEGTGDGDREGGSGGGDALRQKAPGVQ